MKKALITGVTGQDGSYLVDFLLGKGYEVHGIRRRSSVGNTLNIDHLHIDPHHKDGKFFLHYGDLTDSSNLTQILNLTNPDEVYNLGAQSHVHTSFQLPEYTAEVNALGTIRLIDAIRVVNPEIRLYQASTSELYGSVVESPQNELTRFNPQSPYAISKLYSYWIIKNYRDAHGLFSSNGILFNHESPRRGKTFVTRKIAYSVAEIATNKREAFYLGNLNARRDWGYAKEFVEAMWLILQHDNPDDFVIATNQSHTVREFVEKAFSVVGMTIVWEGHGIDEKGVEKETGRIRVEIDPYYYRPLEVEELRGDATKAKQLLGWESKTSFDQLVDLMVEAEIASNKNRMEIS